MIWADIETDLNAPPRFPVQPPDGIKDWSEDARQVAFFSTLHRVAPKIMAHHVKNEGRYNHAKAAKSGLVSGVFDIAVYGEYPLGAVIEMKGYSKAGVAGQLTQKQINWGNRMIDRGWLAACFFCPFAAIRWLGDNGFAVADFSESSAVRLAPNRRR